MNIAKLLTWMKVAMKYFLLNHKILLFGKVIPFVVKDLNILTENYFMKEIALLFVEEFAKLKMIKMLVEIIKIYYQKKILLNHISISL